MPGEVQQFVAFIMYEYNYHFIFMVDVEAILVCSVAYIAFKIQLFFAEELHV